MQAPQCASEECEGRMNARNCGPMNLSQLVSRAKAGLSLLCLPFLLAAGPLSASPKPDVRRPTAGPAPALTKTGLNRTALLGFEKEVQELQTLLVIPGMSMAIVEDQELVWAKGYGFANLERRTPATQDTPYAIASVTKPIAAILLLQLVERGLVNLDDPARKYLSNFKDDGVRIRHLLTHTSEGTPGEKYAYNGDRFRDLTGVIEKVTGKPFRVVLAQGILEKLNMSRSVPGHDVLDEHDKIGRQVSRQSLAKYERTLSDFAKPYIVANGEAQLTDYPPKGMNAAAGLISTAVDLSKFDIALDRRLLIGGPTLMRAWTPAVSPTGNTLPYGLGWFTQRHQGVELVWHYGYWQQFSALYLKLPERNLTLIVLANSNGLSAPFGLGDGDVLASPFACSFIKAFVIKNPNMCDRAQAALADWRNKDKHRQVAIDPTVLDPFVGEYELRRPGFFDTKIIISREQNKLMGSFSGENTGPQSRFELTQESATRFFWKGEAVTFTFERDPKDGRVYLLWREFGRTRRLPKV